MTDAKPTKLPCTFAGTEQESVRAFLNKAAGVGAATNLDEGPLARLTRLALTGKAAVWIERLEREGEEDADVLKSIALFPDLRVTMMERFGPRHTDDDILAMIAGLTQGRNEPFEEFWDRCRTVGMEKDAELTPTDRKTELYKKQHAKDIRQFVLKGVRPEIRRALPAISTAGTLEDFHKTLRAAVAKAARDLGGKEDRGQGGQSNPGLSIKKEVGELDFRNDREVAAMAEKMAKFAKQRADKGAGGSGRGPGGGEPKREFGGKEDGNKRRDRVYGEAPFTCFDCGQWGHAAAQCRQKKQNQGGQVAAMGTRGRGQEQPRPGPEQLQIQYVRDEEDAEKFFQATSGGPEIAEIFSTPAGGGEEDEWNAEWKPRPKRVACMTDGDAESEPERDRRIFVKLPTTVQGEITGTETWLTDPGAEVTMIRKDKIPEGTVVTEMREGFAIQDPGGGQMGFRGRCEFTAQIGDRSVVFEAVVVDNLEAEAVLGMDFLEAFDGDIKCGKREVWIGDVKMEVANNQDADEDIGNRGEEEPGTEQASRSEQAAEPRPRARRSGTEPKGEEEGTGARSADEERQRRQQGRGRHDRRRRGKQDESSSDSSSSSDSESEEEWRRRRRRRHERKGWVERRRGDSSSSSAKESRHSGGTAQMVRWWRTGEPRGRPARQGQSGGDSWKRGEEGRRRAETAGEEAGNTNGRRPAAASIRSRLGWKKWQLLTLAIVMAGSGAMTGTEAGETNFRQEGKLFLTDHFVHIKAEVDTSMFKRHCDSLRREERGIQEVLDKVEGSNTTMGTFWSHQARLKKTCEIVEDWPEEIKEGEKRSIAIVAGLVGTLFGWFGLSGIIHSDVGIHLQLRQENRRMAAAEKSLVQQSEVMHRIWGKMKWRHRVSKVNERMGMFNGAVTEMEQHVRMVGHGLNEARRGRVSDAIISARDIREMQARVAEKGVRTPLESEAQVYQLPASLMHMDTGFMIIIHMPTIAMELDLFWLETGPILTTDEKGEGWRMMEVKEDRYIATGDKGTHSVGSPKDLRRCLKINTAHFCHNVELFRKTSGTCIEELFFQQPHTGSCQWRQATRAWATHRAKDGEYRVDIAEPTTTRLRCGDGPTMDAVWKPGRHKVRVSQGCTLETDNFVIMGTEGDESATIKVVQVEDRAVRATRDGEGEKQKAATAEIDESLEEEEKAAADISKARWFRDPWVHNMMLYAALAAVTAVLTGTCAFMVCRFRRAYGREKKAEEAKGPGSGS